MGNISTKEEKELKNSMTEVEMRQIQSQREFETIKKDTARYLVGLANDIFAKNARVHKSNIEKAVWSCENLNAQKFRKSLELEQNKITSEITDGVTMTREELELEIKHIDWLKEKEKQVILQEFWAMAQLVGKKNVIGQIVLTEESYESLFVSVIDRLKKVGVNLLN